MIRRSTPRRPNPLFILPGLLVACSLSCEGERGKSGVIVVAPEEEPGETLPGTTITILSLIGGSGPGNAFQPGDRISFRFTVETRAGNPIDIATMGSLAALVSGPTFNYQRVLARVTDLRQAAISNGDAEGSYTYTFAEPIPGEYLPPLNDSPSFGPGDGELAGQPLLSGTYTLGVEGYKTYTVDGVEYRDAGNTTADFLLGSATTPEPRDVVTTAHCNQCHRSIRAHGGSRVDNVTHCLLCHTSGAEDRNAAGAAGGTPGVTIDFRVMIHKIHNAAHLPSVLGVATRSDGTRDYAATPRPYEIVGFNDTVHDFSAVAFPVWPNLSIPMPRDAGYSALTAEEKALDDAIRMGVTACDKCHGDPDRDGPIEAPGQGGLVYAQPTRRACGSCHDDVDWDVLYAANSQAMGPQPDDSGCNVAGCHPASGTALSPLDAHIHPLLDPAVNPGTNVLVSSLVEAGANDGDGTIDPGEKIRVEVSFTDDGGAELSPGDIASVNCLISGPVNNRNLLLSTSIPLAALAGPQPHAINVPEAVLLEYAGDASGSFPEDFTTSRAPHWNVAGAVTTVRVRTGLTGVDSTLATASLALDNHVDLASAAGFLRNDFIVVDDGAPGLEEYAQVTLVDGNRLWLNPALRFAHAAGAPVDVATLVTKAAPGDYTLDLASGTITEASEFGAGNAVIVSYTSDYILPAVFPPALNDSPDLGEVQAKWKGLSILDGTYELGIYASRNLSVTGFGETTTYRSTSLSDKMGFLAGGATELTSYDLIPAGDTCTSCHDDLLFHGGGRRGLDTCILCHGTAGSEDRARYTAANAPATTGVAIEFREMLHKIHRGRDLAGADTYQVIGFGSAPYPDNFTVAMYDEVGFPAMPEGVKQCDTCHGESDSWKAPIVREHPEATVPARSWTTVCTACHDSSSTATHAAINTAGGVESCGVCHGPGREFSVEVSHRVY
jgi:hypothetical protein